MRADRGKFEDKGEGRMGLEMLQKEYKGVIQHFCITCLKKKIVFAVTLLFFYIDFFSQL